MPPDQERDAATAAARPAKPSILDRNLYLDLLVKVLTNTIYADAATNPAIFPRAVEPFSAERRAIGRDWPTQAHTMVGRTRLENLLELAQRVLDEGVVGDFIETGVWRGGCCILLRGVLAANAIADRRVYAADSFAGLPRSRADLYPADAVWDLHGIAELAIPLDTVKDNFARYGLLDEQVVFVPGMFSDTLPSLEAGPFALLRLDGDLYESTYVALKSLYPKLSSGGVVIVDDYALEPCRMAVADYRDEAGITAPLHDIDWTGVYWRKP